VASSCFAEERAALEASIKADSSGVNRSTTGATTGVPDTVTLVGGIAAGVLLELMVGEGVCALEGFAAARITDGADVTELLLSVGLTVVSGESEAGDEMV